MKRIVVIGGGGHAKVIISILKKLKNWNIVGYTDIIDKGDVLGIKYLGTDNDLSELYKKKEVSSAAIGIGQIKNTEIRKKTVDKIQAVGFEFPAIISPDSIINEQVIIGDGTVIMDGVVINSGTKIGKYSIINTRSSIDHDCKISDFVHIAPGVVLSGGIIINKNCLIGTGSTILQNCRIDEGCIIGAGAVVIKDCIGTGTFVGVPAKKKKL